MTSAENRGSVSAAVERTVNRSPYWVRVLVVAMLGFAALCGWAVSTPVGSSPDDDYHLASIWCAAGEQAGCRVDADGTVFLAKDLVHGSVCYVFQREESAGCQGPDYGSLDDDEWVEWSRGNYDLALYPPVFYEVMGVFASDDAIASVWAMRILNAALFIAATTAAWLLLSRPHRDALAWPLLIAITPLALFIVPSTNPSTWAFLSAFVLLPSTASYVESVGRRRTGLGVLIAVAILVAAGARADAAGFAVVAVAAGLVLGGARLASWKRLVWIPALAIAVAALALVSSRQAGAFGAGLGTEPGTLGLKAQLISMVRNLPLMPDLVQGALGGWGLGWLDTPMPYGVSVFALLVLGAVVAAGMRGSARRRLVVVFVLVAAMVAYPLLLLARTGAVVGGYFQPRYLFPLLVMVVAAAVIPMGARRVSASYGQALTLALGFSFAAAVSHYALMRRFVTGTDGGYVSLGTAVEWWDAPVGPMIVWIGTSVATAAVFAALSLALARRAEPEGALPSAQEDERS